MEKLIINNYCNLYVPFHYYQILKDEVDQIKILERLLDRDIIMNTKAQYYREDFRNYLIKLTIDNATLMIELEGNAILHVELYLKHGYSHTTVYFYNQFHHQNKGNHKERSPYKTLLQGLQYIKNLL